LLPCFYFPPSLSTLYLDAVLSCDLPPFFLERTSFLSFQFEARDGSRRSALWRRGRGHVFEAFVFPSSRPRMDEVTLGRRCRSLSTPPLSRADFPPSPDCVKKSFIKAWKARGSPVAQMRPASFLAFPPESSPRLGKLDSLPRLASCDRFFRPFPSIYSRRSLCVACREDCSVAWDTGDRGFTHRAFSHRSLHLGHPCPIPARGPVPAIRAFRATFISLLPKLSFRFFFRKRINSGLSPVFCPRSSHPLPPRCALERHALDVPFFPGPSGFWCVDRF